MMNPIIGSYQISDFSSVNLTSWCANFEPLPSASLEIQVNNNAVPKIFDFGQVAPQ